MATKVKKKESGLPGWLPVAISSLALLVSTGAATISYFGYVQTRKFAEINIRPFLHTGGRLFSDDGDVIFVSNRGKGVASLISTVFKYEEEELFAGNIEELFDRYLEKYNTNTITKHQCKLHGIDVLKGVLIYPDESISFLKTRGVCPEESYIDFMAKLQVEFKYKSLSGEEYFMTFVTNPSS